MLSLFFIPIGLVVGTLSGFFGIGGGIVLVPILLLAGFTPALAVATSLMFTLGTSLSGAAAHTRMHNVNWRIAALVGTAGAVSAQLSNRLVIHISGQYDWLLNVWFILLLCYFTWSLYNKNKKGEKPPLFKNHCLAAVLIGLVIGFLSSLLGIGGGFVTVPLLISWLGFDSRKAIGTSLATIIIVSIGGIAGYGTQMELNYLLGLFLIIGAFMGSPIGAKMTARYQVTEITQRLWKLYLVAMASMTVDLLAFFLPPLEWLSLAILLIFLGYMLFDFYRHRNTAEQESA